MGIAFELTNNHMLQLWVLNGRNFATERQFLFQTVDSPLLILRVLGCIVYNRLDTRHYFRR